MKQKIAAIFFSFVFIFSLWGKAPTREMPYEIFYLAERSYSAFGLNSSTKQKEIRNDKTWIVTLHRKDSTDYIVFKYKEKAPSKKDIENMLEKNKSIWRQYNKDNGDIGLCHIFLDSKNTLICSAEYSEEY